MFIVENHKLQVETNNIEITSPKKPSLFLKIWKDSVGSKIIATAIIAIFAVVAPIINSIITSETFVNSFTKVVNYNFTVYQIFIAIFIFYITLWLISKFVKKDIYNRAYDMYDIKVNDVLFGDLVNTLKTHTVPLPPEKSTETMKSIDLLSGFLIYARNYSLGINELSSNIFLSHTLGGLLHSYGLLKTETTSTPNREITYTLSPDGIHFYKLLNIYRMLNNNEIQDW